jgi:hypothetical protein
MEDTKVDWGETTRAVAKHRATVAVRVFKLKAQSLRKASNPTPTAFR